MLKPPHFSLFGSKLSSTLGTSWKGLNTIKLYSNKRKTTLKRWLKPSLLDQRHASPIALPAVPHLVHIHWPAPASLWRGLISKKLLGTKSSRKSHSLTLQLQANAQLTCGSPVLGLETKRHLGREGLGRGRALA